MVAGDGREGRALVQIIPLVTDLEHSAGAARGRCIHCDRFHSLSRDAAVDAMKILQLELTRGRVADPTARDERGRQIIGMEELFRPYGGKMFGVLVGDDADGETVTLRAFSGQLCGAWRVPGWCDPVFDVTEWLALESRYDPEIRRVTARLEATAGASERAQLRAQRADLSRALMERYHGLYRFENFRGRMAGWDEVLDREAGIASGMGDCCAPKLLSEAAERGIFPRGMAEFYWGAKNRAETREHGVTYPPCEEKCEPLLGFMLCGSERDAKGRGDVIR